MHRGPLPSDTRSAQRSRRTVELEERVRSAALWGLQVQLADAAELAEQVLDIALAHETRKVTNIHTLCARTHQTRRREHAGEEHTTCCLCDPSATCSIKAVIPAPTATYAGHSYGGMGSRASNDEGETEQLTCGCGIAGALGRRGRRKK